MGKDKYSYSFYLTGFNEAKETATELIAGLNDEAFKTRPGENKWCIGEILSHLVQIGHEYLHVMLEGLDKPESELPKGTPPFRHPVHLQWFIHSVGPHNQIPLPTVKSFKPKELTHIQKDPVLGDFLQLQDTFISLLEDLEQKKIDLSRVKVKNPILSWITMNVSACFAVIEAHQRRHFNQIRELKEQFTGD